MSIYRVSIEEDAKFDIAEAYDWYLKISEKICTSFLLELKKTLDYLIENPFLFQLVYKDFRKVPVKRFPFVLLYKIETDIVKLYRVFPTNMDPTRKFEVLRK